MSKTTDFTGFCDLDDEVVETNGEERREDDRPPSHSLDEIDREIDKIKRQINVAPEKYGYDEVDGLISLFSGLAKDIVNCGKKYNP